MSGTQHKRTAHQKERADAYRGEYDTQSSHVISAAERVHFNLPNKNDSIANYHNNNTSVNQSNHQVIDNNLLKQSSKHTMQYDGPLESVNGSIPLREVQDRVLRKIDVAKETGDIHNERERNFLKKAADGHGLDMRAFNGYKKE